MFVRSPAAKRTPMALAVATLALCSTQAFWGTAAHAAGSNPRDWAVVAGPARFEVLTPRLVRTEYAGDKQFVNAGTFNVVGRNKFDKPKFTSETVDGWLTITTSAMVLKYKVGSGAFNAQNLVVQLIGDQPVTAAPWQRIECGLGNLCEAEQTALTGDGVAADHTGYTGDGFAAGFTNVEDGLTVDVNVPSAGTYSFQARYANGLAGDNQHVQRSLTVAVAGGNAQTLALPITADWNTWAVASNQVQLSAGKNTLRLYHAAGDSGNVNIDSLAVVPLGGGYPDTSTRQALECAFGSVCEAENGKLAGSATPMKDHAGFAGRSFVAELNQGASITTRIINVPADGTYTLQVRYANSTGGDGLNQTRTVRVSANGVAANLNLPVTGNWDTWKTGQVDIALKAGTNDLLLSCPDAASCHVNADTIAVTPLGTPTLTPHVALGGYRRSVDGVDGVAPITPGLLYRDGWYLLDDTPSALYDTQTGKLTARRTTNQAYQDGYVFAYGSNYKKALGDLATLTGPSMLLPRWAYGVWYSEYYDRTAADYQNTIIPRFRSEGVPIDVLVTDTDFKAPNTWNGWEIDTRKFPDPKGYFNWLHSQGIFTTFNIHSSIVGSDPQFAQAQATAKGKLTKTSFCGWPSSQDPAGCYGFDWADPDQLAAYMGLHQTMEQQGVDFWWLDLCCDGAQTRRRDVTSDAWINQQYATDANKQISRGFAFSRAFGVSPGNNQPNEPTGPWADKRTTVHFTGDSTSSWRMLAAEVGYTPAESASTGLSAVSHDIGGFNNAGDQTTGAEPGSTRMSDDMYARWVQLGTFQPILRLHGNHSDRLPWQYGPAGKASSIKFLRLREQLVPTTYSLAWKATKTGVPVVRAMYLEYPTTEAAYTTAWSQYFYGPDLLVAPAVTAGNSTSTSVWFPSGRWTDYFSGATYSGGGSQSITTDLNAMPVFLKEGGMLVTRSDNAPNDVQNPMKALTVTVATGAKGKFTLYEDDGKNPDLKQSATTAMAYDEAGGDHTVTIKPASGSFTGQVQQRSWSVAFMNAAAPSAVLIDGVAAPNGSWAYDAGLRRLTVQVAQRSVQAKTTVSYR
ncbi:TIM-barrel domain-containing protein [Ideonella sp. DXS29W]|uniref:TIM-barrel domain-containing protein n=1 Tax=Ideonella lacteola TaxID=2984193 RepID=A0ABU9BJ00_9BURK